MRRTTWLVVVALLAMLVYRIWSVLSFAYGKLPLGADAYAYFAAANALWAGVNPIGANLNVYLPEATFRIARYLYPPLLALVLTPLTCMPFATGMGIWLGIVALTTLALVAVLRSWLGWRLALAAVMLFLPTWQSLWLGQINALIAVLGGLALLAVQHRSSWSGVWLALGVLIKLMPGVALVVLLAQRRWRSVTLATLVIAVAVLVTLPWVPLATWYGGLLVAAIDPTTDPLYVSWTGLLRHVPGVVGSFGSLVVVAVLLGATMIRGRVADPLLGMAGALLVPLLVATIVWDVQMIIALPSLAVIWQTSRRGRMIAAATWFGLTLIGGIATPVLLTLCWVACYWPVVLSDPQPRPIVATIARP